MRRCWVGLSVGLLTACAAGDSAHGVGLPMEGTQSAPTATSSMSTPAGSQLSTTGPVVEIVTIPPDQPEPELITDPGPGGFAFNDELPPEAYIPNLPVQHSELPAKPIIGGTLLVTADGAFAVAADPDRDQIYVVDLARHELIATLPLEADDEPGRLTEDDAGRVYVALRRGGAVVSIDVVAGVIEQRFETCAAPRGLAFDPARRAVVVACYSGEVQRIDVGAGEVRALAVLPVDLRDVAVSDGAYWVSRLKSAELYRVDPESGEFTSPVQIPTAYLEQVLNSDGSIPGSPGAHAARVMRRLLPLPGGGLALFHQRANVGQLVNAYYGRFVSGSVTTSGVVHGAVSQFDVRTAEVSTLGLLPFGQFFDLAIRRDGTQLAAFSLSTAATDIATSEWSGRQDLAPMEAGSWTFESISGQASALAYDGAGRLLVQLREPAALQVVGGERVELSTDSRWDTGHVIFHHSTQFGVACASCHPEGGDDGVTWHFAFPGARQTQPLHGGILATLPLHWEGERATVTSLLLDTYVSRMGGSAPSVAQSKAFGMWLDTLQAPRVEGASEATMSTGAAVFQRAGCSRCHSGERYTDNTNHDVGTGGEFQTPPLIGLRYSAPYMHDGCAQSLQDRFDAACGGTAHGDTSGLSEADVNALSAYLEAL